MAINDWSEANFYDALNNVLHDPKYTEAAKMVGSAMNDQIDRPLDRAVWWIEHVMRHPTMYQGTSPAHKLTWYQYFLLDVVLLCVGVMYILFKVFQILCARCCSKRSKIKGE